MKHFSKRQRIKTQNEFGAVLQNGEKFVCSDFVAFMNESSHPHSRLGIIASKKIGNAIARNKAKRRFREIFRQLSFQDSISQRDFVIIARRKANSVAFEDLNKAVSKSMQWFKRKLA